MARKGVERRAGRIQGEYRRPLAALDSRYHGVQEDQRGPLVRRLEALQWRVTVRYSHGWWEPFKKEAGTFTS